MDGKKAKEQTHESQLLLLFGKEDLESTPGSDEIDDGSVLSSSLEEGEELGSFGSGLRSERREKVSERVRREVERETEETNLRRVDDSRERHVLSGVDTSKLGDSTGGEEKVQLWS